MGRSGYDEDGCDDTWALIRWRGAVASAFRGKRGQDFLKEMLSALDSLPEKKLIAYDLERDGSFCAIGAVGRARGISMKRDTSDYEPKHVANIFGISRALACEIMWVNDEAKAYWVEETDEQRFLRVRNWIEKVIVTEVEIGNKV